MTLKIIDGGGPDKEQQPRQRDREMAENQFSWALRETAANMLRIIRGAGKPYDLLRQMQQTVQFAVAFQEAHGYWPFDELSKDLRLEDERESFMERRQEGSIDAASIDRWRADGTFDQMDAEYTIKKGMLQVIASELIGQSTQKSAGRSEFHEGLRELERVREERHLRYRAELKAGRAPKKKSAARKSKAPRTKSGDIKL